VFASYLNLLELREDAQTEDALAVVVSSFQAPRWHAPANTDSLLWSA
jgi:hypothetical protein